MADIKKAFGVSFFLCVLLVLSGLSTIAEEKTPIAVFFITYVFEATSDGPDVYPIFPGDVTLSVLETVLKNADEYKERLRTLYPFQRYGLRHAAKIPLLLNVPHRKKIRHEFVIAKDFFLKIQSDDVLKWDMLPFSIELQLGKERLLSTRLAGKSEKPIVVGRILGSAVEEKGAFFVVITPFFLEIQKASHYDDIVNLYKRIKDMAPESQVLGDYNFFVEVNRLFKERYSRENLIDPEKLVQHPPTPIAQQEVKKVKLPSLFVPYDTKPEPIGGFRAIQKNLIYPENAKKAHIKGRVYLGVAIDEKGNIVEARVIKSVAKELDEAAIKAIKAVKWKPAMHKGKPVAVWVTIPVDFVLREAKEKVKEK